MADYEVVKHHYAGTNIVKLVWSTSEKRAYIWRPAHGHRGRGSVWYGLVVYRLSEELGLGVVPRVREHTIDSAPGTLQDFIDGVEGCAWWDVERAKVYASEGYKRLKVLDYLIGNSDRWDWHVITEPQGAAPEKVWGIDHTNVFQYGDTNTCRLLHHLTDSAGVRVREGVRGRAYALLGTWAKSFGPFLQEMLLRRPDGLGYPQDPVLMDHLDRAAAFVPLELNRRVDCLARGVLE